MQNDYLFLYNHVTLIANNNDVVILVFAGVVD